MLVLAFAALLSATEPPAAGPRPTPPAESASEVEGVTVTARRPDPDAPRPVPVKHVSIAPEGDRLAYVTEGPTGDRAVVQALDGSVLAVIEAAPRRVIGTEWADRHHVVLRLSRSERTPPEAVGFDLRDRSFAVFLDRTPSSTLGAFQPPLRGRPNESVVKTLMSSPVTGVRAGEPVSFVRGLTVTGKDHRFDLYRVNLSTGLSKVHAEGNPSTQQFVVAPDGRVLARSQFNRRSGRWRLQARRGPGWRAVLTREGLKAPPRVLGVGRDGGSVLVRFEEGPAPGLVEVTLDGLVGAPLSAGGGERQALFDRNDGRLIALVGTDAGYAMYEPRLSRAWPEILNTFEGQSVSLRSWTSDYAKLVVRAEGPADAPAFYLVDLAANTARRLRPALPEGAPSAGP